MGAKKNNEEPVEKPPAKKVGPSPNAILLRWPAVKQSWGIPDTADAKFHLFMKSCDQKPTAEQAERFLRGFMGNAMVEAVVMAEVKAWGSKA